MPVTPTGSDGSMPVTIVSSDVSLGGASEVTTLALCTTIDELYKVAVTGTGEASSPSIHHIQLIGKSGLTTANTEYTLAGLPTEQKNTLAQITFANATVKVKSNSVNDTSAGTGARTVKLFGLDSNYAEISETIILNGTTGVASSNSYIAINKLEVLTVGSGGTNAGAISVLNSAESSSYLGMYTVGAGSSENLIYTVPANKTLIIKDVSASVSLGTLSTSAMMAHIKMFSYNPTTGVVREHPLQSLHGHNGISNLSPALVQIPEKHSIWFNVTSSGSGAIGSATLTGVLIGSVLTNSNYWV